MFKSISLGRLFIYTALLSMAAIYLMPLYIMLVTSFKPLNEIYNGNLLDIPSVWSTKAWQTAWQGHCNSGDCAGGMHHAFKNSLIMTIPAVLISTVIGALNGYILSMWRFRGADILFTLILMGCFIPFQVVILPMAQLLGAWKLSGTITGLILVHVVYGLAFTTLFFRNFYVTLPDELVKAARIDGADFWRIYYRIILPLSPPIFVVSIIWQFTQVWNDFLFGIVFANGDSQPVTVALNNLVNTSTGVKEYNVDMAAALLAALPTLFIYIVAGRYFVRGLTAGAVKG